jgi:hypothetical protein
VPVAARSLNARNAVNPAPVHKKMAAPAIRQTRPISSAANFKCGQFQARPISSAADFEYGRFDVHNR